MDDSSPLTESEAQALWARAAELQETSRREAREHANDVLLPASGADGPDAVSADIARQAAIESGIDARFVDAAQLQLASDRFLDDADRRNAGRAYGTRALQFAEQAVTERVVVEATPGQARSAAVTVLATESFASDLIEVLDQSRDRMALVYEIPVNIKALIQEGSFHYQIRQAAEIKRFSLLINRLDDTRSEVIVYARLDRSIRVNAIALRAVQAFAGAGAGVGGGFGASALAGLLGAAGTAAGIITGVGAVAVGLAALAGAGALYRHSYRKVYGTVREGFRRLLTAIKVGISTERP